MQKMKKKITIRKQRYKRVKLQNQEKWGGYKIGIYACVTPSFECTREWSYRPTQGYLSDHETICVQFSLFLWIGDVYLYSICIGIRRKVRETSGICLFLVTHFESWADASSF